MAISVQGPCRIKLPDGAVQQVAGGTEVTLRFAGGGVVIRGRRAQRSVRIEPASRRGAVTIRTGSGDLRPYRGSLIVRASAGRLLIVDVVEVEDYVRSVLPSEMPCDWPIQALAAQAVVARSFAVAERRRHASEGFDLCDLTHCQVYRGASWERPQTDRAVAMTRGIVLTHAGRCISAPYHSTCGGTTTDGLYAGHPPEPYLTPVPDAARSGRPYCAESTHARWTSDLSAQEIADALRRAGCPVRTVAEIRILARDQSGRATMLQVQGMRITAYDFMLAIDRRLGWNKIKNTLFDVRRSGRGFTFSGRGLGHGMGLCQWGALGMANSGLGYHEILRHYYPGCVLSRIHPAAKGNDECRASHSVDDY